MSLAARPSPALVGRAALAALAAGVVAIALGSGEARAEQAAAPTRIVTLGDFSYRPAATTVKVGQPVRFVNKGKLDHTVADVTRTGEILGRQIKPRLLSTGQAQTVTFKRPGTILYLCTLHPTRMKGRIVVTG